VASRLSKSRNTTRAYALDLARIRRYAVNDSPKSFNAELVSKILAELVAANRKPNTKARYISTMREFSRWGVRKGLWSRDYTDDPIFAVRGQVKLPKPFEPAEVERVMALELSPLENAVRAVLYWTGLRVSPVADLLVDNVSFNPPSIRSIGKGDKEHCLAMTPELVTALSEYLKANPPQAPYDRLLRDERNRGMSQRRIERMVVRWGKLAGVRGATPHRFRHTAATELLSRGVDVTVVQKFLNHSNIATTMGYCRVANSALTDAVMVRSSAAPTRKTISVGSYPTQDITAPAVEKFSN
jgi:site-specific recombinase XerD